MHRSKRHLEYEKEGERLYRDEQQRRRLQVENDDAGEDRVPAIVPQESEISDEFVEFSSSDEEDEVIPLCIHCDYACVESESRVKLPCGDMNHLACLCLDVSRNFRLKCLICNADHTTQYSSLFTGIDNDMEEARHGEETCVICYDNLDSNCCVEMGCKHKMDFVCLFKMLQASMMEDGELHLKCPHCRTDYSDQFSLDEE
jgi:hypothetical protein